MGKEGKERKGREGCECKCATYMREKDGEEGDGGVVGMWTSRVRSGEGEVV